MFNFIKQNLKKIYYKVTAQLSSLFGTRIVDDELIKQLELILIQADTGVKTTRMLINNLKQYKARGELDDGQQLKSILEHELLNILKLTQPRNHASVILLVGINGSGKTTCAGKLAHMMSNQGKKVLLVAADTFRTAAPEQLTIWAEKTGVDIIKSKIGQDPSSVVFTGCKQFKDGAYDAIIIDTAGRLQTKTNLMHELEKIKRVIIKQLPDQQIHTYVTIDAMLGQNSFEQAQLFHESTDLSGVILTKMDGTGKGGIIFAIAHQLQLPIAFVSFGEQLDHIKPFDAKVYVHELLND